MALSLQSMAMFSPSDGVGGGVFLRAGPGPSQTGAPWGGGVSPLRLGFCDGRTASPLLPPQAHLSLEPSFLPHPCLSQHRAGSIGGFHAPKLQAVCKQRPDLCERWQMLNITPLGLLGISLKYTIVFQVT